MLRRVEIRGYKSLVDVKIDLKPLVVLFGPNAAGKSNFLDALQLLSRMVSARTLKEAFEPPYRGKPLESFSFGSEGIPKLLTEESASFSIQADIELSPHVVEKVNRQIRELRKTPDGNGNPPHQEPVAVVKEKTLRYLIEVEISPKSGIMRVTDEKLAALNQKGEPTSKRRPFLERMQNRLHLRMEGQAHPTYFERYLDHSILSKPLYPPHHPHLTALREELLSWSFFYFEPRERMRAATPVKEVRHLGLMGEDLAAFLNTLKATNERQFAALEKALRMYIPNLDGIEPKVDAVGEVELRLREGKRTIPARVASEGTLRILGLLAIGSMAVPPSLIGFEEPENGVNPRRLRLIADYIKSRAAARESQIIITTHSTVLADLLPQESLYACRTLDGNTLIEPFESFGGLYKTNEIGEAMDAEESLPSKRILRGDFDA